MEFCSTNGQLLPGFRFHPMDVELVMYYLKRKVLGKQLQPEVIVEMDIYLFHPRDLPEFSRLKKDLYWYFFCPRGKKYCSGVRTNRATQTGYWKATGNDRDVAYEGRSVGKIKTLIFHQGKAPKGERTDWVMHEYRLEDKKLADEGVCQDSYVLCKIFKKSGLGPKNGEQYGAPFVEEEWDELEDNDEIPICTEVLAIEAQNQCASAVTVNACPSSISEQVYSENVSGANFALSSMVMARDYDDSVDQGLTPMPFTPNWASSANGLSPNYCCDPVAQGFGLMSNAAADIASTSYAPPNLDDDEINRILDCFERDDEFRDIFDCLGDLDHDAAQGVNESAMANPYEGGLGLTDLDAPL